MDPWHLLPFAVATGLLASATALGAPSATVAHLRCEEVNNPLGVEAAHPRLSWQIASQQRGWKQGFYRILVASSARQLAHNQGDLWNSGQVRSDGIFSERV